MKRDEWRKKRMCKCGVEYKGRLAQFVNFGGVRILVWYEPMEKSDHYAASVLEMRAYIDGLHR